ncbi:MAG: hypothetical protein IT385_00185 [Deltaproteobacteria bacterium]|nr:hypothetical protein [Deltaproteobacteria bacterium]
MRPLMLSIVLLVAGCESDPEVRRLSATRGHAAAYADAAGGGGDASTSTSTDSSTGTTTDSSTSTTTDSSTGTTTDSSTSTTTDTSTSTTTDTGGSDTTVGPGGPSLEVPTTIAIPWVRAGQGASTRALSLPNAGGAGPVTVTLTGDAALSIVGAPSSVAAGTPLALTLRYAGSATREVAIGELAVTAGGVTARAEVFAMAGGDLPAPSWTPVTLGANTCGRSATVRLPTAPFPDDGASWTDDRVDVFVPEGLRDRGPVDFVVHFHGHGTTLASTLPSHKYREQLWASGVNAVLVTPQGPVDAASGDFGKLMVAGGLEAMLRDVVDLLYKDGVIVTPLAGDLYLTEHSGGYQAVALNLGADTERGRVMAAFLYDGLYGRSADYIAFVAAGGWLRSNYTTGGGTRTNNLAIVDDLTGRVEEAMTAEHLRNADAVVWFTPAAHNDATWWQQAFSEALRWAATRARRGPRVELRSAVAQGGSATVRWLAPDDDLLVGFTVEASSDGIVWSESARAGATATSATFAIDGGRYVRVRARVEDLADEETWASDVYWVEDDADVLVVDGFDRIFGGSYQDIRHASAARVGRAIGAAAASNEAVSEDGLALGDYRAVVWLVGDESVADLTFDPVERALIDAYVDGGGGVVVSGSEVAYELKSTAASFLSGLGAVYSADDANQLTAKGAGPLAAVTSFAFGGANAPYPEDFPDALTTASGATVVLRYGNDMIAAVGRAGASVVVGFPLETIESATDIARVVLALVDFVAP